MSGTMSADLLNRSPWMDGPITIDHIVITDGPESSLLVPFSNVFDSIVSALWSGGAMDDDFLNSSHNSWYKSLD